MARLPLTANTEGNKDSLDDFSAMPPGEATACITSSKYMETKKKNGHYLQLKWKIMEGEHKGRILFDNLNLDNPNPVAVEIANKALNSICQAAGKVGVQDSEELHGVPILVKWKVNPADAQNPASNSISGYKTASQPVAQEDAPQSKAAPTASKKLPWE